MRPTASPARSRRSAGHAPAAKRARTAAALPPRIALLNAPEIKRTGGNIILSRKDAALLAFVALEGPTAGERLAALLWPDVDQKSGANSLRQRIHRLRRAADHTLVDTAPVVALRPDIMIDLDDALDAIAQDDGAATGELLGGFEFDDLAEFSDWVQGARNRWHARRSDAIAAAASRCEQAGELARAMKYAQRLIAEQPHAEHAQRRWMRLHYLRGDRAAALAAFEHFRATLQRELGASPGRETLELAALIERSGALVSAELAPVAKPVAVLRPPRLVGRESEWAQLQRAWVAQRLVFVSGEPGIGKTRLLTDFASAQSGVIVAGARPGDARVPYALLARWLRACVQRLAPPSERWVSEELARIVPELGAAPTGKLEALRLRQAIQFALAGWSASGMQAAVIDDLQFADEATVELLPALAGETNQIRWMFSARSNEMPELLAGWIDAADADALLRLELGPLSLAATEEMLHSLSLPQLDARTWAAPLYQHTGGNPMFMLETLLTIAAGAPPMTSARLPVPANVGQLIEKRLAQLSPAALKLARVAALAGPDFSADLAAQVLGVHALDLTEPWRELEAALVIRDNAFAHDLIFEATLRSVPQQIAQVMHRAIAQDLERNGLSTARVAEHWYAAREWRHAADAFAAAADSARKASRRGEELDLLQRAAACIEQTADRVALFDVVLRVVTATRAVRPQSEAEEAARRLLQLATGDRQAALAHRELGGCLMNAVQWDAAAKELGEARRLAANAADRDLENHCRYLLALATAYMRGMKIAISEFGQLLEWAEEQPDQDLRHAFLTDYGIVLDQGDRRREAIMYLRRGVDYFVANGNHAEACESRMMLARAYLCLGKPQLAREFLEIAVREREELSAGSGGHSIEALNLGRTYLELGMYRQAASVLESARERLANAEVNVMLGAVETALGRLYVTLGQSARALHSLRPLSAQTPFHQRAGRAWVEAQLTDATSKRRRCLGQAVAQFSAKGDLPFVRLPIELDGSLIMEAHDACALCERALSECIDRELPGTAVHAKVRLAQALTRIGDSARAADLAAEVINDLHDVQPCNFYLPEAWWVAYGALAEVHRDEEAQTALGRGMQWIMGSALPNVPPEFRDSFLDRNPVNRALLTTATRRLRGQQSVGLRPR